MYWCRYSRITADTEDESDPGSFRGGRGYEDGLVEIKSPVSPGAKQQKHILKKERIEDIYDTRTIFLPADGAKLDESDGKSCASGVTEQSTL